MFVEICEEVKRWRKWKYEREGITHHLEGDWRLPRQPLPRQTVPWIVSSISQRLLYQQPVQPIKQLNTAAWLHGTVSGVPAALCSNVSSCAKPTLPARTGEETRTGRQSVGWWARTRYWDQSRPSRSACRIEWIASRPRLVDPLLDRLVLAPPLLCA